MLDNGVVVIAKETRKTPAVAINLCMRAGTVCDPVDATGATYLLSRVIDRGTVTRTAEDIADAIDSRGISLTITVTRHPFSVVSSCLARDFETILALLGDLLMSPSIPESELTTGKGEVVTALRQDEDNPAIRASEALMAMLYGNDHPYGRRIKGSIETVEALTRDRLLQLHGARFAPGELSVVVVGDVDVARVFDAASRVFGSWQAPRPPDVVLPPVHRAVERRRQVIPMMNKAQADIAYGFTTITRSDPSYFAFWLMNIVLGQYALGGRLGHNIRERQGMAYYVSSILDASFREGPLNIRAGVSPANVDRAVAAIDDELMRLMRDGLTDKELNESRQYLIGSMPRALETNAGIANFLQSAQLFDLGLDYDVRLPSILGEVTLDDVHRSAQMLDPARAMTRAVFFDVDFTLIAPGPMFRAEGYRTFCERHGLRVDVSRFAQAVANAAPLLDGPNDSRYSDDVYVRYTRRIIEGIGGAGDRVEACAREVYAEWAACEHFDLYEDVGPALRTLTGAGLKIGLISNSHRSLAAFEKHFELQGLIAGAVSSSEHGLMKPHPSIFRAALSLVEVEAAEAVMVGDSVRQDVEGALGVGMRAVLLQRSRERHRQAKSLRARGVPIIRSLSDLPPLLTS
jgi:zinc protease